MMALFWGHLVGLSDTVLQIIWARCSRNVYCVGYVHHAVVTETWEDRSRQSSVVGGAGPVLRKEQVLSFPLAPWSCPSETQTGVSDGDILWRTQIWAVLPSLCGMSSAGQDRWKHGRTNQNSLHLGWFWPSLQVRYKTPFFQSHTAQWLSICLELLQKKSTSKRVLFWAQPTDLAPGHELGRVALPVVACLG